MKYQSLKPGTLLSPVPAVLVSCADETGRKNALAIAWAGTVCSDPPMVSISVRPERYSHELIERSGEFVINLCGREMLRKLDYCGVRSGREEDKWEKAGLEALTVPQMRFTPAVSGTPLYLACRVAEKKCLGSHDLYLADIAAVGVREDLLDETGRLCLERANLVAYSHGEYYGLSGLLAFFGYSVASDEVLKRRMPAEGKGGAGKARRRK